MHKSIPAILSAASLALPVANATAAASKATVTKKVATKKFTGSTVSVDRWGYIEVTITVRKTTTIVGSKKKVTRRIIAVGVPVYPNHTDRSVFINSNALPVLKSETLKKQSANIDFVSGASDTSDGFTQSLQSAILKAKKW